MTEVGAAASPRDGTATGATNAAPARTRYAARFGAILRIEDWLLAGVVALAPALLGVHTSQGVFGGESPVEGFAELGAVLAALVCLAARRADGTAPSQDRLAGGPWLGPLCGGLLLVSVSGAEALSLPSPLAEAYALLALAAMVGARFLLPPLSVAVRRVLVVPFIVVTGRLFWAVIDAVLPTATGHGSGVSGVTGIADLRAVVTSPAVGFLVAFAAVYYAMLVVAPRQVAEREGSLLAWVVRFALFIAGAAFGAGWLAALAG